MSVEFFTGDSYQILAAEPKGSFDVLITDPPYDAHVQDRLLSVTKTKRGRKEILAGFDPLSSLEWVPSFSGLAKRWSLFFCALEQLGAYRAANPEAWVRSGIYTKIRALPQLTGDRPGNRCEGISIFHAPGKKRWNGGGTHAFWQVPDHSPEWVAMPENRKATLHPTAKPLMLCMRLVDLFSELGETVLDPFCGTGNMGIACSLLGRNYLGLDIDPVHVGSAIQRHVAAEEKREELLAKYEEYKSKRTAAEIEQSQRAALT